MGRKEFYDRLEELKLIKQKANLENVKDQKAKKEDKLFNPIEKRVELSNQMM